MKTQTIPLWLAVLININIVVGGAFFIGVPLIAEATGPLACLAWLAVGVLLLPLVMVLAQLAIEYPVAGGLYVYSEQLLGRCWGFVSCWGYFIGTAAGNAVILKAFVHQAQQMGILQNTNSLAAITIFSALFAALSAFNVEILSFLQTLFTSLKAIPFLTVIVGAWYYFSGAKLAAPSLAQAQGILISVPTVLFAYIGIEACCAIAHLIRNNKRNASRAILISFGCIITAYSLTQLLLSGIFQQMPANPFTALVPLIAGSGLLADLLKNIVEFALLSSYLGGFYSMFYANNWNLHTIAHEKNLPFSKEISRLNAYGSPWICIILQTLIIVGLLGVTQDTAIIATMCDFGIVIAYILSVVAYLKKGKALSHTRKLVGSIALVSCGYLLMLCSRELLKNGIHYAAPFFGTLALGLIGYAWSQTRRLRPQAP